MMTDRDSNTGQFTEPAFGLAGIERDAGYVPYEEPKDPDAPEAAEVSSELTVREAAAQLSESRTPESQIRTYGLDLPENVTMTPEQAAKSLTDARAAETAELAEKSDEAIRKEIDELRGVKSEAKEESDTAENSNLEKQAKESEDHSEVERLLAIPHVREAVDKLGADYKSAAETYRQGIEVASFMTRAGLVEIIPDVLSLPQEHQAAGLAALAQSDPGRYAKAASLIGRANQLTALHQEQTQAKADAEAREFAEFSRTESAAFNDAIKDQPKARVREVEAAIIESIKEYGGDDAAFFELFKNTKILHSRVAQQLLYDAGQYRLMKQAAKAVPTRHLPPVSRPGTGGNNQTGVSASIAGLEKQFAAATGDKQIRIAAQIRSLQRANRG